MESVRINPSNPTFRIKPSNLAMRRTFEDNCFLHLLNNSNRTWSEYSRAVTIIELIRNINTMFGIWINKDILPGKHTSSPWRGLRRIASLRDPSSRPFWKRPPHLYRGRAASGSSALRPVLLPQQALLHGTEINCNDWFNTAPVACRLVQSSAAALATAEGVPCYINWPVITA